MKEEQDEDFSSVMVKFRPELPLKKRKGPSSEGFMEDCSNCAAGGAVAHTDPHSWREEAGIETVNLNQQKHKKQSLSS